jgi:microcompartment protein CcmL/EutN
VPDTPDKKNLRIDPALALLEFSSIAAGIQSADAMVKRAALDVIRAGTVQPGRFLVLVGSSVAEVEEALKAGLNTAPDALNDHIFLPGVHSDVVRALAGERHVQNLNRALGIVETRTVPAAIHAADRGVKGAEVNLMEVRLADGLGGKGIVLFTGDVSAVEASLEIVDRVLQTDQKIRQVIIPQVHGDLAAIIHETTRFGAQLGWPL